MDLDGNWVHGRQTIDQIRQSVPHNFHCEYDIICQMLHHNPNERIDAQAVSTLLQRTYTIQKPTMSPKLLTPATRTPMPEPGPIHPPNNPHHLGECIPTPNSNSGTAFTPLWFEVRKVTSNFVGRTTELDDLTRFYQQQKYLVVISGLGGVGKSELVKRFASIFHTIHTGNCIWLDSANEQVLQTSIISLVNQMSLQTNPDTSHTIILLEVLKLNAFPTLFIFDNVDTVNLGVEQLITNFRRLPPNSKLPFVIITTRNRELIGITGGEFLDLKVLTETDAIHLVTRSLQDSTTQDARNLSVTLQRFPLALQQAICLIDHRRKTRVKNQRLFGIRDYLKLFKAQRKKVLGHRLTLADHDYSLTTLTTWTMSFDSIKNEPVIGQVAEELLNMWVYLFDPEGEYVAFVIQVYEKMHPTRKSLDIDQLDPAILHNQCPGTLFRNDFSLPHTPARTIQSSQNYPLPDEDYDPNNVDVSSSTSNNSQDNDSHDNEDRKSFPGDCDNSDEADEQENYSGDDSSADLEEDEVDIMDDYRPTAQAIQLIRAHSICDIDLHYRHSRHVQFVTIHKLVQEVIRLCKTISEEFTCIRHNTRLLCNLKLTKFSVVDDYKSQHQIRLVTTLWKFLSNHAQLITELNHLLPNMWYHIPTDHVACIENQKLLLQMHTTLLDVLGETHLATMVAHYYCLSVEVATRFDFRRDKTDSSHFEPIKLLNLFNRANSILSDRHILSLQTLGLTSTVLLKQGLQDFGKDELSSVENASHFFIQLLHTVSKVQTETSDAGLLTILSILGRVLEKLRDLQQLPKLIEFTRDIIKFFKDDETEGDHSYQFVYILKYIRFYLSDTNHDAESQCFFDQVLNSTYLHLLDFNEDIDMVHRLCRITALSSFKFCPVSLVIKILIDIVQCRHSIFHADGLNTVFKTLIDTGNIDTFADVALKLIETCAQLCSEHRFKSAWPLIVALNLAEGTLWHEGRYKESAEMFKYLPSLCKYRGFWEQPNLLVEWIDDFVLRVNTLVNNPQAISNALPIGIESKRNPPTPAEEANTHELSLVEHSEVAISTELVIIPTQGLLQEVRNISQNLLTRANSLYQEGKHAEWCVLFEDAIANPASDQKELQYYTEAKIGAGLVVFLNSNMKPTNTTHPTPVDALLWGFLFALREHDDLMDTGTYKIVPHIVELLKEKGEYGKIADFANNVAEVSLSVFTNRFAKAAVEPRLLCCFYTISVISDTLRNTKDYQKHDLELVRKALNLNRDETTIGTLKSQILEVRNITSSQRSMLQAIILITLNIVNQWQHYEQDTSGANSTLFDFISEVIDDLCLHYHFTDLVRLSSTLMGMADRSDLHSELSQRFSLTAICQRLKSADNYFDLLLLLKSALHVKSITLGSLVEEETTKMVHNYSTAPESKYHCYNAPLHALSIYCFALKHGSDSNSAKEDATSLLHTVLKFHFSKRKFEHIYRAGLAISYIPSEKLKPGLTPLCEEALAIVSSYLTQACEQDIQRVRRIFSTIGKPRPEYDNENNRALFLSKVIKVFDRYCIEFSEEIDDDADNSDYDKCNNSGAELDRNELEFGQKSELGLD